MRSLNSSSRLFSLETNYAGEIHELFDIKKFSFLRKCAAIKMELSRMGKPVESVQLRNIPEGSESYYLCYPGLCIASAYQVEKNKQGQIIKARNRQTDKVNQEAEEFIDLHLEEEACSTEEPYPIADPTSIEFYVYADERNSFQKTTAYNRKKKLCKAAVKELENSKKQIFLKLPALKEWLNKHRSFYWSLQLDWNFKAFHQFQGLYQWFLRHSKALEHLSYVKKAIEDNFQDTEAWLKAHHDLYHSTCQFFLNFYEPWISDPFTLKQVGSELYLVGREFQVFYEFGQNYEKIKKI